MDTNKRREPSEGLKAFLKMRGSVIDEPIVHYWEGYLYRQVNMDEATPDYPATGTPTATYPPLFKVAGMSTNRAYYDAAINGWYWLGHEVQWYLDPVTGAVLETWDNPLIPRNADGTGGLVTRKVNVLATQNDFVNWVYAEPEETEEQKAARAAAKAADIQLNLGEGRWKFNFLGNLIVLGMEVFIKVPSPMADDPKYDRFSANDTYQAAELFRYYAKKDEVFDPKVHKAEVITSWTRLGPYLPWMHMGRAPGGTVIFASGYKVLEGFAGLPEWMKREVREKYPTFAEPQVGKWPNKVMDTSFTVFKRELDAGRYVPTPVP